MTKSKPKPVKPVLAWCAVRHDGVLLTESIFEKVTKAAIWYATLNDGALIRVEIRPAPKRKSKRTQP